MEDLMYDDLTVLIEALDAWTSRDFGTEIMGIILDTMFLDKLTEKGEKKKEEEKKRKEIANKGKKEREKEIAILLKAKLINLKQKMIPVC